MAFVCEVCGKGTRSGNNVSHSVRRTKRTWKPNLQKVKVIVNGTPKRMKVCAACLRSNKVQRAM
ncbi:50S ribosomal protein L28 [Criibacterium bergeronii]|uniref:Large ribosomal subunit protein bL28 n=1 Tax=Criibacterium bergeronii TaxID=1871336 RepID=A0A1C0ADW5_9FIRM|nr:50S ribosomal protein L28 [Criibacterium bergeronii]MBS6062682.1 50S ribosomal protein L28 [Peptostreptococcaceae bacterium]RDY21488.1 50S ribosomal protein L28 [Criibacterium bergeronii]TRW27988.1 50S ribosomal protein L28 [Criibacterium bergeronii]